MKNQILSQLLDGELSHEEMEDALDDLLADPEMQQSWYAQHTLRAVIKGDGIQASSNIVDKVAMALAEEPTIIARDNLPPVRTVDHQPADNVIPIGQKRTKVLAYAAIAASFAAIVMVSYSPRQASTPTIADTSSTQAPSMAVEQELQSMIVQHGEFSGAAALNGLVAYAKVVNGSTASGTR